MSASDTLPQKPCVMDEPLPHFEARLAKLLSTAEDTPLWDAARYSLLSSAKRLRPRLLFATLSTYEHPLEQGLDPACALEMIHTYSLIHDDLPCMDDDDFRRGKPSLHRAFPESTALLAGDFLLTYAFEVLANSPGLSADTRLRLIARYAQAAGAHGMIGGQIMDLAAEGQVVTEKTLFEIHTGKTAQLIASAICAGAYIASAPREDLILLNTLGQQMGIAFQIADDCLDVTGNLATLGKLPGADAHQGKATAVSLLGLETSYARMEELWQGAQAALRQLSRPAPKLEALLRRLIERRS